MLYTLNYGVGEWKICTLNNGACYSLFEHYSKIIKYNHASNLREPDNN